MQTNCGGRRQAAPGEGEVAVLGGTREALARPWHVTELGARVPRVCDRRWTTRSRGAPSVPGEAAEGGPQGTRPGRTAPTQAPQSHTQKWGRGPRRPPQASAGDHHARLLHAQAQRQGRRGWAESRPEVPRRTGLPPKPASRNFPEVPLPAGTLGCWATGAGGAGGLSAAPSKPSVAPTSYPGNFPSSPLPFLTPLLASRNPCPWHYVHLSGSHDTFVATCFEAKLHRERSGLTLGVACTLTDSASRAMATYTYTYTSRPRALPCRRRRYRDDQMQPAEEAMRYGNIMYDRRVIRGSTYALQTAPLPGQPDPAETQRQQRATRRALARKRAQEQLRPRTPDPVEGRKHVDVQTELYLEEIADRIIEVDVECQTDAFLDKPPTLLFIPAKTGKDVATQILEGELFDFDLEVKPMLEVLVGKTIEQSLLEVMEEEELANLRARQRAHEELRNVELAEVQRLEERERRHREEKERRKQQQWQVVHKHNETAQKIAAQAFAQRYLADLLPSVFSSLRDGGYFYDPVERDIEIGFLPWLMNEVDKTMERSMVGRTVVDMLIREVVEKRLSLYERKEDKHSSLKPEDGLSGPGGMRDPLEGYEFQGHGASQAQRPLPHRDSPQRTPYDARYMQRVSSQERKLMEEEDEQTEMRQSFRSEELLQ
ncbi:LOW QUALITY PROTEIN: radial spoke head protein 3 homolog [Physeter macrocephalus]|uniref:LOW QUALITY PROTEIN: radial spoke head protein 3 homolog n=1 Tax=Physeter macrocephalus TaxID=9755 RepID=A0A455BNI5_PHYMC|nr:LOW QUALITY PROTEIN: radial spoke head protein 3 homolog [Physeter catodon]